MKIAIPVKDENLTYFNNAGHTPFFAVYEMKGGGMFKSFVFSELRKNPRTDLDHHDDEGEHHACSHDHDDEDHVKQHHNMAEAIEDCQYLVTTRACKNTAAAMQKYNVKIQKYSGTEINPSTILSSVSASLV